MNRGCIPTKALIHASTLYREYDKSVRKFGLYAGSVSLICRRFLSIKICPLQNEGGTEKNSQSLAFVL